MVDVSEHTDARGRLRNRRASERSLADRQLPSAASLTPFLSPRWGWETLLKRRKTNALETPPRLLLRALNVTPNGLASSRLSSVRSVCSLVAASARIREEAVTIRLWALNLAPVPIVGRKGVAL